MGSCFARLVANVLLHMRLTVAVAAVAVAVAVAVLAEGTKTTVVRVEDIAYAVVMSLAEVVEEEEVREGTDATNVTNVTKVMVVIHAMDVRVESGCLFVAVVLASMMVRSVPLIAPVRNVLQRSTMTASHRGL